MNLLKSLALLTLATAFNANAIETPWIIRHHQVLTCPSIGAAYDTMLNDLEALKTSIKKGRCEGSNCTGAANCDNVQLKVDSLEKLVTTDRDTFLALIEKSKTTALTNEEGQAIATYMEGITKKVASISDLFMNSNYCFAEDAAAGDKVASMAGFINEASQLIGSVAGPWGAPIAIGGRIVAGLITGIDAISKTRAGYTFTDPKQWRNYVNNLCTFYNLTPHINNLLEPEKQVGALENLETKIGKQIGLITARCTECQKIVSTFNANQNLDPVEMIKLTSATVKQTDSQFTAPLGSYTLQATGLKKWASDEKTRVLKESAEFSKDASGRYLLNLAKTGLVEFLYKRSAPSFLSFQLKDAFIAWGRLEKFINTDGREVYNELATLSPDTTPYSDQFFGPSPEQVFDVLMNKPIPWDQIKPSPEIADLQDKWESFQLETKSLLSYYRDSIGAFETFCQFFRMSGNYGPVHSICKDMRYSNLLDKQSKFVVVKNVEDGALSLTVIDAIEKTIADMTPRM